MSVPVNRRHTSSLEWQSLAATIRVEIIQLMGSEKIVPKSMRFTLALPTVKDAHRLMREIVLARDSYPTDYDMWVKRRNHLINCVSFCDILEDDLALIKQVWSNLDLNRLDKTIVKIEREKQLLRARIQADRKHCKEHGILDVGCPPFRSANSGNTNNVPIVNTDGTTNNNNANNNNGALP